MLLREIGTELNRRETIATTAHGMTYLQAFRRQAARSDATEAAPETASRVPARERKLYRLLGTVAPGDLVLFSELSRLGRSVGQIIDLLDALLNGRSGSAP